jgi:hypothetical protein
VKEQTLRLRPFGDVEPGLTVTAWLARRTDRLSVRYAVRGDVDALTIPPPAAVPGRRGRLWEKTCFELFLAPRDSAGYWELNLSPAGHWNVYRFDAYREGMQEEAAVSAIPLRMRREPSALRLALELGIEGLVAADESMDAGVSAVLRRPDGRRSYWALAHCGPTPDFHLRESFLAEIAGGR